MPHGWHAVQLGSLGRIFNGSSLSASQKLELEGNDSGIPFLATKDLGYASDEIDYDNGWRVTESNDSFRRAQPGTLLICLEGGSAGKKMGIVNQEVCFGNKLFAIDLDPAIDPRYLQIVYQSTPFQEQFSNATSGIISGISKVRFSAIVCPIPPLEEQSRIVAEVDRLLLGLDQLLARRREADDFVKDLRSTSIQSLVGDSYTEEFNSEFRGLVERFGVLARTVEGVNELRMCMLDLIVRGAFSPGFQEIQSSGDLKWTLPSGWRWIPLSDLIDSTRGVTYGIIKLGKEPAIPGVPVLRCSDVKYRGFDLSGLRTVDPSVSEQYSRTILEGGEVVVNVRGTLGGCAIVPDHFAGFNVAREVAVMMPSIVSAEYLLAVLSSNYFANHVLSSLRGISYRGMNLGILKKTLIPLPPKAEEERLVALTNETMRLFDALEETVRSEAQVLDELTTALRSELKSDLFDSRT